MELVSIDIFAQYSLNGLGKLLDHKIVKFGSGAGPKLYRV